MPRAQLLVNQKIFLILKNFYLHFIRIIKTFGMKGSETSPPAFSWDDWYQSVGGRTIKIAEVDEILYNIREYQYPKFNGQVNAEQTIFESTAKASEAVKQKAFALGAD